MIQEDKQLLLVDLCARLPYKVVAQVTYKDSEGWKTEDRKVLGAYADGQVYVDCVYTNIENVKPYLRPMSSMTEEEKKEFYTFQYKFTLQAHEYQELNKETFSEYLDWLNKNMFDYRGLIPKGLALEAPEGMYD